MKAKETKPGPTPKKRTQSAKAAGRTSVHIRWLIAIFLMSLVISTVFSFSSQQLLSATSLFGAFLVLFAIIAVGILFDLIGIAVTAAEEKPFHSMAARKVPGALEAIRLLRSAGRVSSVCNDVVGDICGVVSGAAAAVIALEACVRVQSVSQQVLQTLLSALVAALTICGKAFCKQIALDNSTAIVHLTAKVLYRFKHPFSGKNRLNRKK